MWYFNTDTAFLFPKDKPAQEHLTDISWENYFILLRDHVPAVRSFLELYRTRAAIKHRQLDSNVSQHALPQN